MTAEAIPFRRRESSNILSTIRSRFSELTRTGGKEKDPNELPAFYMGLVLAHQHLYKGMTSEAVDSKVKELAEKGLPVEQISRTFSFFTDIGGTFDWLDIEFQVGTLDKYWPELLPHKPE